MRKIAVVFPGIGYTKDRPLLYYTGKLAVFAGYELVHIDFSGLDWSKEKLRDSDFMQMTAERCRMITDGTLSGYKDLSGDDVIFISKSIGTVVAADYAKTYSLKVRHICFSPLEKIGELIENNSGILLYGDNDPLADYEVIERIAREKQLSKFRVKGGNHSLETGDIPTDIKNLEAMIKLIMDRWI